MIAVRGDLSFDSGFKPVRTELMIGWPRSTVAYAVLCSDLGRWALEVYELLDSFLRHKSSIEAAEAKESSRSPSP